jgi:hypothetical protein
MQAREEIVWEENSTTKDRMGKPHKNLSWLLPQPENRKHQRNRQKSPSRLEELREWFHILDTSLDTLELAAEAWFYRKIDEAFELSCWLVELPYHVFLPFRHSFSFRSLFSLPSIQRFSAFHLYLLAFEWIKMVHDSFLAYAFLERER